MKQRDMRQRDLDGKIITTLYRVKLAPAGPRVEHTVNTNSIPYFKKAEVSAPNYISYLKEDRIKKETDNDTNQTSKNLLY
jgi:hypothetical protein